MKNIKNLVKNFRELHEITDPIESIIFSTSFSPLKGARSGNFDISRRKSSELLPIVFVGVKKSGKSTCANMFVRSLCEEKGRNYLDDFFPVSAQVCTNVPTEVVYAEKERIKFVFFNKESGCFVEKVRDLGSQYKKDIQVAMFSLRSFWSRVFERLDILENGGNLSELGEEVEGESDDDDFVDDYFSKLSSVEYGSADNKVDEDSEDSSGHTVSDSDDSEDGSTSKDETIRDLLNEDIDKAFRDFKEKKEELKIKKERFKDPELIKWVMEYGNPLRCEIGYPREGLKGLRIIDMQGFSKSELLNHELFEYARNSLIIIYVFNGKMMDAKGIDAAELDLISRLSDEVADFDKKTIFCGSHFDVVLPEGEVLNVEKYHRSKHVRVVSILQNPSHISRGRVEADKVFLLSLDLEKLKEKHYKRLFRVFLMGIERTIVKRLDITVACRMVLSSIQYVIDQHYGKDNRETRDQQPKVSKNKKAKVRMLGSSFKMFKKKVSGLLLRKRMEGFLEFEQMKKDVCKQDFVEKPKWSKPLEEIFGEEMYKRIIRYYESILEKEKFPAIIRSIFYQCVAKCLQDENLIVPYQDDILRDYDRMVFDSADAILTGERIGDYFGIAIGIGGLPSGLIAGILLGGSLLSPEEEDRFAIFGTGVVLSALSAAGWWFVPSLIIPGSAIIAISAVTILGVSDFAAFVKRNMNVERYSIEWRERFVDRYHTKILKHVCEMFKKNQIGRIQKVVESIKQFLENPNDVMILSPEKFKENEQLLLKKEVEVADYLFKSKIQKGMKILKENFAVGANGVVHVVEIDDINSPLIQVRSPKGKKKGKKKKIVFKAKRVVRALKIAKYLEGHESQISLFREAHLNLSFSHKNLVSAEYCYLENGEEEGEMKLGIVMNFLQSDLGKYLRKLSLIQRIDVAIQIAQGLEYLHKRGLVHRDLKPSNVLVGEDDAGRLLVKICDYGCCKRCNLIVGTANIGNPVYNDPRVTKQEKIQTSDVDIFSFGLLLVTMWEQNHFHLVKDSVIDLEKWMISVGKKEAVRRYLVFSGIPTSIISDKNTMNMKYEVKSLEKVEKMYVDIVKGCVDLVPEKRMLIENVLVSLFEIKRVLEETEREEPTLSYEELDLLLEGL